MEVERRKVRKKKKDRIGATTHEVVQENDLNQTDEMQQGPAQPEALLEPTEPEGNDLNTNQMPLLEEEQSANQLEDATSSGVARTEGEAVGIQTLGSVDVLNASANVSEEVASTDRVDTKDGSGEALHEDASHEQRKNIPSEKTAQVEEVEMRTQEVTVQEVAGTSAQEVVVQEVAETTHENAVEKLEVRAQEVAVQEVEARAQDVAVQEIQAGAQDVAVQEVEARSQDVAVQEVQARAQDIAVQEVAETRAREDAVQKLEARAQEVAVQEVKAREQDVAVQKVETRAQEVAEPVLQPSAPVLLPSATVTSAGAVLYPNLSEVQVTVETLQPWSEEELCRLYVNPQLEALEQFTDNFVMQSKRENDEFYELLTTYLKTRLASSLSQKQLEVCRNEYHTLQNKAWTIESKDISASGKCGDGRMVTANHMYKVATANREALETLSEKLTTIRRLLCDELCMASYSCQVAKLHIEHYIHHLLSSTPGLNELPSNAMVTSHIPSHNPTHLSPETARLKDCISVLFIFERRPAQDESFTASCRRWLDVLMSALLRVATLSDHQFILHHLLRCPPGIGEWGTKFLQIPSPMRTEPTSANFYPQQTNWDPQGYGVGLGLHRDWGGPVLDHVVTQLATLLLPIKQREEFLACLEVPEKLVSASDPASQDNGAWQFVTESLECESEDDQTLLKETDLIALYDQFPINDMFRHVLMVSSDDEFKVEHVSSEGCLRLLAFATCLIRLLGSAFTTFRMVRYKEFVKRVGRTIRHTVHYVSDHWLSFQKFIQDSGPGGRALAYSLPRLQVEYDQFVVRSARWLLTAHKLGAWQFLADLPYSLLSLRALLHIFYILFANQPDEHVSNAPKTMQELESLLQDSFLHSQFIEKLMTTLTSETVFLLTTFANMTRSRVWKEEEKWFIKTVALYLFEITQVAEFARDVYSETGATLLETIATRHPCIISDLINRAKVTVGTSPETHILCFKFLRLHLWHPTSVDMETIRDWLINYPISSAENEIARMVLISLSWGHNQKDPTVLSLPCTLHREVAVMLVVAHSTHLPNEPGGHEFDIATAEATGKKGLMQTLFWGGTLTKEQEEFQKWCWKLAMMLKLHPAQISVETYRQVEDWASPSHMGLTWANLFQEEELVDVARAVRAAGLLATYVGLCVSSIGTNLDTFLREGLPMMIRLTESGYYLPCLRVLSNMFPRLLQNEKTLIHDEQFLHLVFSVAAADAQNYSYFTFSKPDAVILHRMADMVQAQFQMYNGEDLLRFWLTILTAQQTWYKEGCILHLLNQLCQIAVRVPKLQKYVQKTFTDSYQDLQPLRSKRSGFLSSLATMAGKGSAPFTYSAQLNPVEYPWLSFTLLWAETDFEVDIWGELVRVMHYNKKTSLDGCMKKALEALHLPSSSYPSWHLAIFRWANLALTLPIECPAMVLVWQKLFNLHLQRPVLDKSRPLRESFGHRILGDQSNLVKRLKTQVQSLIRYHKERVSEATQSGDEAAKTFHQKTAEFYSKVKCWVDEPRLHEADLNLPSLPAQFDVPRLQEVFEPQIFHLWCEFVPVFKLERDEALMVEEWVKLEAFQKVFGTPQELDNMTAESALSRILARLNRRSDPVPPPPLNLLPNPLQPVPTSCYYSSGALQDHLRGDLLFIQEQARLFAPKEGLLVHLDSEFLYNLPRKHRNVPRQFHVSQTCNKKNNTCVRPATIIFKFDEMVTDDIVVSQIEQNRAHYEQSVRQLAAPAAAQLCAAIVTIEQIVVELSRVVDGSSPADQQMALDTAIGLFYSILHFVTMDTQKYPPTCQFFSSALTILGQQFLSKVPDQSLQVLQVLMDRPLLANLLIPIFDPNSTPAHFVTQYQQVVDIGLMQHNLQVVFALISKFNVSEWITRHSPDHFTCQELLKAIVRALSICGIQPTDEAMLFEVLQQHFGALLRLHLSPLLQLTLELLLEGMDSSSLAAVLWRDLRSIMRVNKESNLLAQTMLPVQEIQAAIQTLSSHFATKQIAVDSLYCCYSNYCSEFSEFMKFILSALMMRWAELGNVDSSSTRNAIADCWHATLALFGPWILPPATPTPEPVFPWLHEHVDSAHCIMAAFVATISTFHSGLPRAQPISLAWQFYLQHVAIVNQPLFILEVYHSEFAQLPWQHFLPQREDLESMIKLRESIEQPSLFSFCCHVCTKIDWLKVISSHQERFNRMEGDITSDKQGSVDSLSTIYSLVLRLMVMVSQDPNITSGQEASALISLLDLVGKLTWNHLDGSAMKEACTWLSSNCQPKDILMKWSPMSLAVGLLKTASEFPSGSGGQESRHPECSQKQQCYVQLLADLIAQCTNRQELAQQDLHNPVKELLTTTLDVAIFEPEDKAKLTLLLEEALNLLNTSNPTKKSLAHIIAVIKELFQSFPNMHLIAMVTTKAAVRTIVAIEHMIEIVETATTAHFAAFSCVEDPEQEWRMVRETMAAPETIRDTFLSESVVKSSFLCLFGASLNELAQLNEPRDELDITIKMTQWCGRMKPDLTQEGKALLLWWKTLQLLQRQVRYVGKVVAIVPHITELAQTLCRFGEDKATDGLLGAIGLGKKSVYSLQLRLLARGVGCFLHCQLPLDKEHKTQLRVTPNALGFVRDTDSLGGYHPTKAAEQSLKSLTGLMSNKSYGAFKEDITYICDFVANPKNNLMSVLELFVHLTQSLFPSERKTYLAILCDKA